MIKPISISQQRASRTSSIHPPIPPHTKHIRNINKIALIRLYPNVNISTPINHTYSIYLSQLCPNPTLLIIYQILYVLARSTQIGDHTMVCILRVYPNPTTSHMICIHTQTKPHLPQVYVIRIPHLTVYDFYMLHTYSNTYDILYSNTNDINRNI